MPSANVRRRGMGDPEATFGPVLVGPLGSEPVGGAVGRGGKSLVARTRGATPRGPFRLTESRAASLLERSPTPASSRALARTRNFAAASEG